MAAEERRKQKEQIKILKQQVGLLCGCADCIFPVFSLSKCPDTHTPCEHCGKCWIVIFWSFKAYFSITIITCSAKLVVVTFCRPNWNRVVGKWFYLGMSKILRDYVFLFLQEKIKRIQQIRMEKELRAQQILEVQNLIQQHLWLSRTFLDSYSPSVYSVLIFLKLITEQQHALEGVASS